MTSRTPACEDAETIAKRLAELRRERDAARDWKPPETEPAKAPTQTPAFRPPEPLPAPPAIGIVVGLRIDRDRPRAYRDPAAR